MRYYYESAAFRWVLGFPHNRRLVVVSTRGRICKMIQSTITTSILYDRIPLALWHYSITAEFWIMFYAWSCLYHRVLFVLGFGLALLTLKHNWLPPKFTKRSAISSRREYSRAGGWYHLFFAYVEYHPLNSRTIKSCMHFPIPFKGGNKKQQQRLRLNIVRLQFLTLMFYQNWIEFGGFDVLPDCFVNRFPAKNRWSTEMIFLP